MAETELTTEPPQRTDRLQKLTEMHTDMRAHRAGSRAIIDAIWQERIDAAIRALEEYEEGQ